MTDPPDPRALRCPLPSLQVIDIDFTPPFRRISMCSGLEEALDMKLPADMDSEEARAFLVELVSATTAGKLSAHLPLRGCVHSQL